MLRAYASLYLDEEVRLKGWARLVGTFARFLEAISFSHASVLNDLTVQHLRAWLAYRRDASGTRSGVDVDFIVYASVWFWAIDMKNTTRVRAEDLRGLESFGADYPHADLLFVYRGTNRERRRV